MQRVCTMLLTALLVQVGWAAGGGPVRADWGPIFSRQVDASGDLRIRWLGPFFERSVSSRGQCLHAMRPFYAGAWDPRAERQVRDFLWPLGSAKRFHEESSWRLLVFYGQRFDVEDPASRRRVWLLPF